MYFRNRTKKFTEDCFSSENIQGLRLALEEGRFEAFRRERLEGYRELGL